MCLACNLNYVVDYDHDYIYMPFSDDCEVVFHSTCRKCHRKLMSESLYLLLQYWRFIIGVAPDIRPFFVSCRPDTGYPKSEVIPQHRLTYFSDPVCNGKIKDFNTDRNDCKLIFSFVFAVIF